MTPYRTVTRPDETFVSMRSEDVVRLANQCLADVETERRKAIDAAVAEHKSSWWYRLARWLGIPAPTNEEVERGALGCEVLSLETLLHLRFFNRREAAEKLLVAARHAESVFVSADDLRTVTR